MQLSSLRVFHWLIIILLIIFNNYEILFQRVFGHVEPASSARCKLHLRMHLETEATPGYGRNDSFSFLFLFCVCSFYFRPSDTHDFVHFFHPHVHAPPSSPDCSSCSDVSACFWVLGLFWFPLLLYYFFNYFSLSAQLGHPKIAHRSGGAHSVVSFLSSENFLRASCSCHLLLAFRFFVALT